MTDTAVSDEEVPILYGWYFRSRSNNVEFWWAGAILMMFPIDLLEVMPDFLVSEIRMALALKDDLTD